MIKQKYQSAQLKALIREIDEFLEDTGKSPVSFGNRACGNGYIVARMKAGYDVTTFTAERLRKFMAANRAHWDE